jgi:hypothetical protein
MSSKKYKNKLCTYCWKPSDSADHVPSKNVFSVENRQLVKVPSCKKCNAGFSRDDEYLRMVVSMEETLAERDDVKPVAEDFIRSLYLKEKQGFLSSIQRSIGEVDRYTPSGIYIGKWGTIRIDNHRLQRIAERITRALYFHESGEALPTWCKVTARHSWDFRRDSGQAGESFRALAGHVLSRESRVIANGKFTYHFTFCEEFRDDAQFKMGDYFTIWYLNLYDRFDFLSFTGTEKKDQARSPLLIGA